MPDSPPDVIVGVIFENSERSADHPFFRGLQLRLDEVNRDGGVQGRGVGIVFERADGAHSGQPERCIDAWHRLAQHANVVGIIGPGISDNCLPLVDVIDEGQVPTINWSGSEETRGSWYFQFQWGSLPDEADYLAGLLGKLGRRRVGVLSAGLVGEKYYEHFKEAAAGAPIDIVAYRAVGVHQDDVTVEIADLRRADPEAAVFLGMGAPTLAFGRAIRSLGWEVARFANIAMLAATLDDVAAEVNEGIVWTDQYEPANRRLREIRRSYERRFGEQAPETGQMATGYEVMTLMLAGLERAPEMTRAATRLGLERVRNLPCAVGGRNAVMGFGPWERSAIKGPDLLMYRTIRDGLPVTFSPSLS